MTEEMLHILVADDDAEDRLLLDFLFREAGYDHIHMHMAEDGVHAIELLGQLFAAGLQPDMVILDVNMPRMNGWETLRAIKDHQQYRSLMVVMFSTSEQSRDKGNYRELGAADYLVKPIDYASSVEVCRHFYALATQND